MKPRILVVEDETIVALDIRGRLVRLGYEVAGIAASGEAAMLAAGEKHPDLILMDVHLGSGIDGVETAARIKEHFRIPVVFITAFSDDELITRIRLTEPFAYILKPFEEAELHAAIEIAFLRHRLENAVGEQRQLLAATLNSIDDGVIVTGEDGRIRFMNPVAEELTGWTVEEALGEELGVVYVLEAPHTLVSKNGTRRTVEFRSNLMVGGEGQWNGFVHAFTDVSEREAARRELHQREREYRMLMEQAADAILISDPEGHLLAVNSRACELLGYAREELLTMSLRNLFDIRQSEQEPLSPESLGPGQSAQTERRMVTREGRIVDVEISARGMSDGRIQGILRDITERKRAEHEFRQAMRSEAVDRLLTKLHALRHGENARVNLNRLALFLENLDSLRLSADGTGGDGTSPLHRFRVAADEYEHAIAPQILHVSSLMFVLDSDASLQGAIHPASGGAPRLSKAAQELRTALPEVLSLVGQTGEEEHLREVARHAARAVQAVKDITQGVHDGLRKEFTCEVNACVRLAVEKFRCQTPWAEVYAEETPHPLPVLMKEADLHEVISTLITNALEACTLAGGSTTPVLWLRVRHAGSSVWIEVEDNGPGIGEDQRDHIFEDSYSTKGEGRGFGLGYALRSLKGCGGHLRLDRTSPAGSRFVIELTRL